jgi:hypothetical protein
MNNPFYLYTLPIDKVINLLDYALFIFKLMILQQNNDIIIEILKKEFSIDLTCLKYITINRASKNVFRLEPMNKHFSERQKSDYRQKMSGIVGAHLKSFMIAMIDNFKSNSNEKLTTILNNKQQS